MYVYFHRQKTGNLTLVNCEMYSTFLQRETDGDNDVESSFDDLEMSSSEEEEGETTKTTGLSISNSVIKLIIMFLVVWKTLHNISDSAICILCAFFKKVIELLAKISQSKAIQPIQPIYYLIPCT